MDSKAEVFPQYSSLRTGRRYIYFEAKDKMWRLEERGSIYFQHQGPNFFSFWTITLIMALYLTRQSMGGGEMDPR